MAVERMESSSGSTGAVSRCTVAVGFVCPILRFGPLTMVVTILLNVGSPLSRPHKALRMSSGLMTRMSQPPQLPIVRLRPLRLSVQVGLLDADAAGEELVDLGGVEV